MVDKSSPEWKAHHSEYMKKYRADPLNHDRILQQQRESYQRHREERLAKKRERDLKKAFEKMKNKPK